MRFYCSEAFYSPEFRNYAWSTHKAFVAWYGVVVVTIFTVFVVVVVLNMKIRRYTSIDPMLPVFVALFVGDL